MEGDRGGAIFENMKLLEATCLVSSTEHNKAVSVSVRDVESIRDIPFSHSVGSSLSGPSSSTSNDPPSLLLITASPAKSS